MPDAPQQKLFNPFAGDAADGPPSPPVERDPETGRFTKSELAPALQRQARAAGLTDDDLDGLSPAEVRQLVRDHATESRFERLFSLQEKAAQAQSSPVNSASSAPADDGLSWGTNAEGEALTEADWNPFLRQLAKDVADLKKWRAAVEPTVQDLPQIRDHVHAQVKSAQESFARRVDKAFAKYPDIFGDGPIDKLDAESPEFHFRMAAVKAHRQAGSAPDDLEADIDAFVAKRFRPAAGATHADEVSEWEAGVLGRSTQRGMAEPPPGREKAAAALRAKLPARRNGTPPPNRGSYLNPKG